MRGGGGGGGGGEGGGGKTIEMWRWWWWRGNNGNVVAVVVERKQYKCGGGGGGGGKTIELWRWWYHDPSDLGSVILIRIIPRERTPRPQDNLGFWIPSHGFQSRNCIPDYLSMKLGLWIPIVSGIPNSLSCIFRNPMPKIPDSTS